MLPRSLDFCTAISIHALVKRATVFVQGHDFIFFISIHALVKRATQKDIFIQVEIKHFNPRPRKEGDRTS